MQFTRAQVSPSITSLVFHLTAYLGASHEQLCGLAVLHLHTPSLSRLVTLDARGYNLPRQGRPAFVVVTCCVRSIRKGFALHSACLIL